MIGMLWRGGRRFVYFMIVVVLGYLCQVCVMPYLAMNGVTASMLFAVTAIVTVCYGKLRAFWVGAWYGIVMEIMLPSITFLTCCCILWRRFSAHCPLRIKAINAWNTNAASTSRQRT